MEGITLGAALLQNTMLQRRGSFQILSLRPSTHSGSVTFDIYTLSSLGITWKRPGGPTSKVGLVLLN